MKRVKKNRRIITKMKVQLKVKGIMSFSEIKDWIVSNDRNGLTSNQLCNILATCGHFRKVGMIRRAGYTGSSWMETTWEVANDEAV